MTVLLEPSAIATVSSDIRAAIPRAVKVISVRDGQVPIDVLLGLKSAAEDDIASRPSHHDNEETHDHDDFETFIVDVTSVENPAALAARAKQAAADHDVLRIKGFAAVDGRPMRLLLQGVGQRVDTRFERQWAANEPRLGRLVVIGQKGLDRAKITAILEGNARRLLRI